MSSDASPREGQIGAASTVLELQLKAKHCSWSSCHLPVPSWCMQLLHVLRKNSMCDELKNLQVPTVQKSMSFEFHCGPQPFHQPIPEGGRPRTVLLRFMAVTKVLTETTQMAKSFDLVDLGHSFWILCLPVRVHTEATMPATGGTLKRSNESQASMGNG